MTNSDLMTRVHKLLDAGYVLCARASAGGPFEVHLSSPDRKLFSGTGNDLTEAFEAAAARDEEATDMMVAEMLAMISAPSPQLS